MGEGEVTIAVWVTFSDLFPREKIKGCSAWATHVLAKPGMVIVFPLLPYWLQLLAVRSSRQVLTAGTAEDQHMVSYVGLQSLQVNPGKVAWFVVSRIGRKKSPWGVEKSPNLATMPPSWQQWLGLSSLLLETGKWNFPSLINLASSRDSASIHILALSLFCT